MLCLVTRPRTAGERDGGAEGTQLAGDGQARGEPPLEDLDELHGCPAALRHPRCPLFVHHLSECRCHSFRGRDKPGRSARAWATCASGSSSSEETMPARSSIPPPTPPTPGRCRPRQRLKSGRRRRTSRRALPKEKTRRPQILLGVKRPCESTHARAFVPKTRHYHRKR